MYLMLVDHVNQCSNVNDSKLGCGFLRLYSNKSCENYQPIQGTITLIDK